MKIKVVRLDDWERLYIDGELIDEHHSLDLVRVLEELERRDLIELESVYGAECNYCCHFEEGKDSFEVCPKCGLEQF